jgi:hypothetical protein
MSLTSGCPKLSRFIVFPSQKQAGDWLSAIEEVADLWEP